MAIQKAKREKIWTKLLLSGPSGSGKTFSALRVATGLARKCKSRILLIDTEAGRSKNYAAIDDSNIVSGKEFDFDISIITEPFTPEKYIEAINEGLSEGYQVIIIDSISHDWSYCVETHDKMPGNSWTNWGKITPRHDAFMEKILQSPAHIIATVRGKDEYVLEEKNGKQTPKKVGLGYKQRDGIEYEYTATFNIAQDTHVADSTKDNTHLFEGRYEQLTERDGEALYDWANAGVTPTKPVVDNVKIVQDAIVEAARTLGGSQNPKVCELCTSITGEVNPYKVNDIEKLEKLLAALKSEEQN